METQTPPIGCLGKLLRLIRLIPAGERAAVAQELPYRLRDDFLSPAERSFHGVLVTVVGPGFVVCPKVNVADVLFVARPHEHAGARNRIDRKHVDFLICEAGAMMPVCAVELDDASHERASRRERDAFLDAAFAAAGLPLVHVKARAAYSVQELGPVIQEAMARGTGGTGAAGTAGTGTEGTGQVAQATGQEPDAMDDPSSPPVCPKCGVPMVQRRAKRGTNAGEAFWGCANYPRCREIVAIAT